MENVKKEWGIEETLRWINETYPDTILVAYNNKGEETDRISAKKIVWMYDVFKYPDYQDWDSDDKLKDEAWELLEKSSDPEDKWAHEFIKESHEGYAWQSLRDMIFGFFVEKLSQ